MEGRRKYSPKEKVMGISATVGFLGLSILGCRYLNDNTGSISTPQGIVEPGPTPNQTLEYYESLFANTPTPTSESPSLTRVAARATSFALSGITPKDLSPEEMATLEFKWDTVVDALTATPVATARATPQATSTQ